LWLTGATTVKHFSRFYVFLGGTLCQARWQLWARIIEHAARWVPLAAPIVLEVNDSTKKKVGTHIEGVARYRNGAGSARQEYRTLRGLNFVWGIIPVPLARDIVACVAAHLPERQIRVLGAGVYATKEYLRRLPASVEVVSRVLITGKLYAPRLPLL